MIAAIALILVAASLIVTMIVLYRHRPHTLAEEEALLREEFRRIDSP